MNIRITGDASFLVRPYAGRTARLVDVSVVQGFDDLYEIQLDPPQPYDPESLWVKRSEFELATEPSLGERLGFQPTDSRTHSYNGQEHR